MIILSLGDLGGGKTLINVILSYKLKTEDNRFIYTNHNISFMDKKLNPLDLVNYELENCVAVIDEGYTILEARHPTKGVRLGTYFFFQSRKKKVDIFLTAQIITSIDLRATDIADVIIWCERKPNDRPRDEWDFKYKFISKYNQPRELILRYEKAKQFFNMYDTNEIILPIELEAGSLISFEELLEIFNDSPTKQSFITYIKELNPYLTLDIAKAVYDYIKAEKYQRARTLLRID